MHQKIDRSSCPMCREHVNLENLTRLYGIDPSSSRPENSSNNQSTFVNRNKDDISGTGKPDYVFKIVLLGNSSVGKSSLLERFTTGEFKGDISATTGCDLCFRTLEMGGRLIKLTIWDTVGQEKFRSIATNCVRNAHGVMLVYDVMDVNSFSAISDWMKFVDDYAPSDANRILIGNKLDVGDQRRMVPQKHGKALANKLKLSFFETSAKEANNVEAAFRCLVGEIMENTVLNPASENYDDYDDGHTRYSVARSRSGCRLHLPYRRDDDHVNERHDGTPECLC
ncbi:ras-related protein RIC1 isoform X2 [Folsomia candida]|uniref:ras-related protein RIC1 isoform X2 n=1 Tax=Folsomia candida TaxID=158441 RepID=UPI000B8FF6A6|nr:ras-related protein RIC1 isoform X2 [Folsomia candida]